MQYRHLFGVDIWSAVTDFYFVDKYLALCDHGNSDHREFYGLVDHVIIQCLAAQMYFARCNYC